MPEPGSFRTYLGQDLIDNTSESDQYAVQGQQRPSALSDLYVTPDQMVERLRELDIRPAQQPGRSEPLTRPPLTIGLEIEYDDDRECNDLTNYFRNDLNAPSLWRFVRDGSCGGEAVSEPLFIEQIDEEITKLTDYLEDNNVVTNDNCSIHVHIGAANLTTLDVAKILVAWADFEPQFFKFFKPLEHRRQRYCRPIDSEMRDRIDDMINYLHYEYHRNRGAITDLLDRRDLAYVWTGTPFARTMLRDEKYTQYRYQALNLSSLWLYGTIEFRLFNGTLDADLIKAYTLFAHDFIQNMQNYQIINNYLHPMSRRSSIVPRAMEEYYYSGRTFLDQPIRFTHNLMREMFSKFRHGDFLTEVLLPA